MKGSFANSVAYLPADRIVMMLDDLELEKKKRLYREELAEKRKLEYAGSKILARAEYWVAAIEKSLRQLKKDQAGAQRIARRVDALGDHRTALALQSLRREMVKKIAKEIEQEQDRLQRWRHNLKRIRKSQ